MSEMTANGVEFSEPLEIANGLYWLGARDTVSGFHHNHYMLMEEDQGIIISAGHSVNILDVLEKFSIFIPVNRIIYAAFNGSVAQTGGAMAIMEEAVHTAGGKLMVVSHPRASHKIAFYHEVKHESFYLVDQNGWNLTFNSGRTLRFINSNNLSYPGSFMTYDEKTGALFSGELFSGYPFGWSLYANGYYIAAMEAYHYDHMPFGQLINRSLDGLDGLDIRLIAPSHGSIIDREIGQYVEALRNIKKLPAISRKAEPSFNKGANEGDSVSPHEGRLQ
jgi:flavorubredoxin